MNSQTLVIFGVLLTIVLCQGEDGSKCSGTSCTPAPPGASCQAKYGRDDGCCPEWVCTNGQSIYGMSKGGGGTSFSSSSFSFGSGGGGSGGGFGGFGGLPGLPKLSGFPFFGRR